MTVPCQKAGSSRHTDIAKSNLEHGSSWSSCQWAVCRSDSRSHLWYKVTNINKHMISAFLLSLHIFIYSTIKIKHVFNSRWKFYVFLTTFILLKIAISLIVLTSSSSFAHISSTPPILFTWWTQLLFGVSVWFHTAWVQGHLSVPVFLLSSWYSWQSRPCYLARTNILFLFACIIRNKLNFNTSLLGQQVSVLDNVPQNPPMARIDLERIISTQRSKVNWNCSGHLKESRVKT